ncbi:MAG TPA: hypothetical protein ACFYD6_11865 [Candidatus Brocadiia bacterium]|nr:hypothetical protein [Candidatus Brocadiales bacterium]
MANLVNCIECSKQVSSSASQCPYCGKDPRSIACIFCGLPVKLSNEIHAECIEKRASRYSDFKQYSCPVCHTVIAYKHTVITYKGEGTCPKCGHPFTFKSCHLCHRPVEKNAAKKVRNYNEYDVSEYDYYYHYHESCKPPSYKFVYILIGVIIIYIIVKKLGE